MSDRQGNASLGALILFLLTLAIVLTTTDLAARMNLDLDAGNLIAQAAAAGFGAWAAFLFATARAEKARAGEQG